MKVLAWPAFSLKEINPYQWLLYSNMVGVDISEMDRSNLLTADFDILHVHWPDEYITDARLHVQILKMLKVVFLITMLKLRRRKLVWTVHNVRPHLPFRPRLEHLMLRWFRAMCDGLIFLTASSREECRAVLGIGKTQKSAVIPHGHYRDVYPAGIDTQTARGKLGVPADSRVLLMLGQLKPYKNAVGLIDAASRLEQDNVHLLLAGSAEGGHRIEIEAELRDATNITAALRFVPAQDLPVYYSAADVVVLPFTEILNSGSVILALSYSLPVIVPDLPVFRELRDLVGADWVHLFDPPFSAEKLKDCLERIPKQHDVCELDRLSWRKIADQTRAFYREVLEG